MTNLIAYAWHSTNDLNDFFAYMIERERDRLAKKRIDLLIYKRKSSDYCYVLYLCRERIKGDEALPGRKLPKGCEPISIDETLTNLRNEKGWRPMPNRGRTQKKESE